MKEVQFEQDCLRYGCNFTSRLWEFAAGSLCERLLDAVHQQQTQRVIALYLSELCIAFAHFDIKHCALSYFAVFS